MIRAAYANTPQSGVPVSRVTPITSHSWCNRTYRRSPRSPNRRTPLIFSRVYSIMLNTLMFSLLACLAAMAVQQPPRSPDVNAQRQAMKRLGFLVGQWQGQGRMLRAPGEWIEFDQTEHGEYKLDGLLLVIEGEGRAKGDGRLVLQAYSIVSYDDATGKYHMRAFNDGRWLESDIAVADNGKELTWGFALGEISTQSTLRLTDSGKWTESDDITISTRPAKEFMELTVKQVPTR